MTDNEFRQLFLKPNGKRTSLYRRYLHSNDFTTLDYGEEVLDFINRRYADLISSDVHGKLKETVYRLCHDIEKLYNRCAYCRKTIDNVSFSIENGYTRFCSDECKRKHAGLKNSERIKTMKESSPDEYTAFCQKKKNVALTSWNIIKGDKTKYELCCENAKKNNKKTWALYTSEQKKLRSQKMSEGWERLKRTITKSDWEDFCNERSRISKAAWENKTLEQKKLRGDKIRNFWANASEEWKSEWWKNVLHSKNGQAWPNKISKEETDTYNVICEKYPDAIRWYKNDNRYKFYECDIYIPSLDAFIECQYFKTHGKHPYNPDNVDDVKFAECLKNDTFVHYDYKTFTQRDPDKRQLAKKNNLNFYEIWSIKDIDKLLEWLEKLRH